MKIRFLTLLVAAAAVVAWDARGFAQGTTGAGFATGGVTSTTAPSRNPPQTGFAVQDGVTYFVRNGRATPVSEQLLPHDQVMINTGRLVGDPLAPGFILEKGTVYYGPGAHRVRVDAGLIPGGQIMTLNGVLAPMPLGLVGFPGTQAVTIPGPAPAPATSAEPR